MYAFSKNAALALFKPELSMLLHVHPINPQPRTLKMVAEKMNRGELFILPTDTVYAFATVLDQKKTIEKIYRLKEIPANKPLSLYCRDFSQAAEYVRLDDNQIFRWMKSNLPGPFTIVLKASKTLPQYTLTKQRTVGIRVIDHPVVQGLLELLNRPIIGSSVFTHEQYLTYPEDLESEYGKRVAGIVDTGPLELSMSTILDGTEFPMKLLRQGKGEFEE